MTDQALKDYFKFDEADLTSNRSGQFSEKQRRVFEQENRAQRPSCIFFVILVLVMSVCPVVEDVAELFQSGRPVTLEAVPALLWLIAGSLLAVVILRFGFGPDNFTLKKVEGPLTIATSERSVSYTETETGYKLLIGEREFPVEKVAASLLEEGSTYAIYFAGYDDRILSMERLTPVQPETPQSDLAEAM